MDSRVPGLQQLRHMGSARVYKESDKTEQLSLSKSMVKVGLDLKWNDFFNVLIDSDRKVEFYC